MKVRPGVPAQFWILSQRLYGYLTHYDGFKTVAHIEPADCCASCRTGQKPRWMGVLAVMDTRSRGIFLLGITPGAYNNCPPLQAADGRLRGIWIVASRLGDSVKSGLRVVLQNPPSDVSRPRDFPIVDVPAALSRQWQTDLGDSSIPPPEPQPSCD